MSEKEIIARRVAQELHDGDVVNLGIGLPTLVANYVPQGMNLVLQSENGILGMDSAANEANMNPNITNAGGFPVTVTSGASFFDSAMSFAIIRGGHVNVSVLGALQVDQDGSLASHIVPGKMVPGMGGAMDLVTGSKRVIIAMTHTAKGVPKILERITLPATAISKVHLIVTELAVIEVTPDGLALKEIAQGKTVREIQAQTGARLIVEDNLKYFNIN